MTRKLTPEMLASLGVKDADIAAKIVAAQTSKAPKMITLKVRATPERLTQLAKDNPDVLFRSPSVSAKKAEAQAKAAKAPAKH